jgi:diguanylate cyclase (GGDEF)-like protein/PAS domain S-box-containing protein
VEASQVHTDVPGGPADAADVARLFELSTDLLASIDVHGNFVRLNPEWERVLGWTVGELMARPVLDFVHPDDVERTLAILDAELADSDGDSTVERFSNRCLRNDGTYRWLRWNARRVDDTWYGVARDVTDHKQLEEQALRDPLTGLPNRVAFVDRLNHALDTLQRSAGIVAVVFVDLDHFKLINDAHGHEVGDRFLVAVAGHLCSTLRRSDTVARFGGDEFVLLVEDGSGARDVAEVGERIVTALERPFTVDGDELRSSGSVGIAVTDRADLPAETLLREADVAMYRAKARGGGRCELFDHAMRAEVERRVRVQSELSHALEAGELRVHYQPIVALPETSVTRCEALVRWEHPSRGLLPPASFIPLAEETGLILPLGEWVLLEACRQAHEWRTAGSDLGVTVNVSTRQLAQDSFVDVVRRILEETRLPAPALCLEVTETAIMDRPDRIAPRLEALQRLGVRTAMDDFGSGYSSLTYLKSLPLDVIKIDKSFVAGLPTSSEDRAIVAAILSLARETEVSVIAEGVETESLHAELVGLGCGLGQGFLYARPKPAAELVLGGYSPRISPGVGLPDLVAARVKLEASRRSPAAGRRRARTPRPGARLPTGRR